MEKSTYKKIIEIVSCYIGYKKGQKFNTLIPKKVVELSCCYPDEVILGFLINEKDLLNKISSKEFDNDYGKISYFFAVVQNRINDYYKLWKSNKVIEEYNNKNNNIDIKSIDNIGNVDKNNNNKRDISSLVKDAI